MIDFALLQQCNIVQLLVSESLFLSADTSAIRASPFLAPVECNPVAYDIKYDCKTIFCCRGPARCQLHHFWALKVSPHDEVMLTLREKDNDPTACTDSQSTDHASNCEIVPTPGLWSWCQATRLIATPMITDEPLHETFFRNQLQNELSDGQSGTSLLCEDKIFSRVHHSMIADVSLPYIDCMVKMI